jgi:glycogen debranching enzyme
MPTPSLSALSFDDLLAREWFQTNGLGGFASSTLPNLNTRKYHGLLVAALAPPVRRTVLLSSVEEFVTCSEETLSLASAEYPNSIHPDGFRRLVAFDTEPFPRWAYQSEHWTIEKSLRLLPNENTVILTYTLLTAMAPVTMQLRPLLALRGIHELMYQSNARLLPELLTADHLRISPTKSTPEIFIAHDGDFLGDTCWYLNTIYRREIERGYAGLEDLWCPGVIRYTLAPGQSVRFVCSTDPIDLKRISSLPLPVGALSTNPEDLLARAANQFIASPNVLTDLPWAPPNVRNALIAFPGLFLCTTRYADGEAFLRHLVPLIRNGLVPTMLPEDASPPIYSGADTSLWFIHAIHQYLRYAHPDAGAGEFWLDVMDSILSSYKSGTDLGIQPDAEALLCTRAANQPTTWMDAKCGDWVITPRAGRPVELNALWYSAMRITAELAMKLGQPARAQSWLVLANKTREAFNRRFWNNRDQCCHDVIADHGPDSSIRPNQIFAISLPYPVLDAGRHEAVIDRISNDLLTPYGLRTLSRDDPSYQPNYHGDIVHRDRAYHQGSAYPWLLGPFVTAFIRVHGRGDESLAHAKEYLAHCLDYLQDQGLGQLPELFDGSDPYHPGGARASARSIGEILRAVAQDILGRVPASKPPAPAANETAPIFSPS